MGEFGKNSNRKEQIAAELGRQRRRRSMQRRAIAALGAVVVVILAVALMVPGISMTRDAMSAGFAPAGGGVQAGSIAQGRTGADAYPAQEFRETVEMAGAAGEGADALTVEVSAPEGAFPAGVEMHVRPVNAAKVQQSVASALQDAANEGDGSLDAVVPTSDDAGGTPPLEAQVEAADIQAVDITFTDAEGREVEPACQIDVRIASAMVAQTAEQPYLVHVEDGGQAELLDAADVQVQGDAVAFSSDAFSIYALVYTVDFKFGQYEFSIAGESEILLSQLFAELGIQKNVADVVDVRFSDPELVGVVPVVDAHDEAASSTDDQADGTPVANDEADQADQADEADQALPHDWRLVSLAPFTSKETLSVIFAGGQILDIAVRDAQHVNALALLLESASVYENGDQIPWPALVRENKLYDIRLNFKEDSIYQFMDTDAEMYYPVPDGLDLGEEDFTHEFTMDVGDGVLLEGSTVTYDAATKRFVVVWNTQDKAAFNKLVASNSAEFRIDFKARFDFTKDTIEFSENVSGKIVKDTSFDVDVEKTGEYKPDMDRIDYTVVVTSYGEALSKDGKPAVVVTDELFGTALTYLSDGENHGVSWVSNQADDPGHADNEITVPAESEQPSNGFTVNVGHMADGEKLTFSYSASVDYEKLTGPGTYDETMNKVVVTTPEGEKERDHSFTNDLHYVSLEKDHDRPINWKGDIATVNWKVTVNDNPKVSMAGASVTDRIYAGDVEAMDYSGAGLHVKVYRKGEPVDEQTGQAPRVFVGEYDVPWNDAAITRTPFSIADAQEGDQPEIQYASWEYRIPDTQAAKKGDEDVTINNHDKLSYDISYTTQADKSLMVFDGYVGNEAQEHKTGTQMQDGFYPPGTGTMPEVRKAVEPKDEAAYNAPKGSNEEYIYWTITFDRLKYDLSRCVIEDNNPDLWGHREPVDVDLAEDGSYEYLYVEGLAPGETWEVSSSTNARTTIKFYRDPEKKKPGLGRARLEYDSADEGDAGASNTITVHLRTANNATWLENTLTNYWPKAHTNTVTWICNAHQVEADATATPDVRKMQKRGLQVGTILRDGVALPVFRFELFLAGIDDDAFADGKLEIVDTFDTSKLALISPAELTEENGFDYTQALKDDMGNNRIQPYWDQQFKGYAAVGGWKGPIPVSTERYAADDVQGVRFTATKDDFVAKGRDDDGESYCLRYSLPYYLVVKDAQAAKDIARELIDSGDSTATFENTATWEGDAPLSDSTTVEAEFKPAQKVMGYNDQRDLATYQLTLNPQALKLNDGQMIRVEDAYQNLAVDFSSVQIETVPADRKQQITWAYHSNKGTFWIPDETVVVVTYRAQPIGDAGKNVSIKNELTMLSWKETVEKTVTLNSESEGSAGDYNIRVFKYKDDFMNEPLSGAVFQLFEVGDGAAGDIERNGRWYKPVRYAKAADVSNGEEYDVTADDVKDDDAFLRALKVLGDDGQATDAFYPSRLHHAQGDFVYFSTGANGYSDVHLSQQRDGLALERGKQYYLLEVVTPAGFGKEDIFWSFIIDDMDFFDSAHGIYQYRDGGVLTVSNESNRDTGIVILKSFLGDARDALDWNQVQFEVRGVDADGKLVFTRDVSFADFVKYKCKLPVLPSGNGPYTYTVTEKNANVATATRTTSVSVEKSVAGDLGTGDEPSVSAVAPSQSESTSDGHVVSFTVTDEDLRSEHETAYKVAFTNTYEEKPVELSIAKTWGEDAQKLKGKTLALALLKDGEEYGLYKVPASGGADHDAEADEGEGAKGDSAEAEAVYRPVALSEASPAPESERIVLSDGAGWSVRIQDLPRFENGRAIQWSVKEVGASYTQDGNNMVVSEDDMDLQFNISAAQLGLDGERAPVAVSHAQAPIDTTSAKDASITLHNELATLSTVIVKKAWYDKEGKDATATKTDDDAVTYDLYRTTEDLPKGGKDRETFTVVPIDDATAKRIEITEPTVEVAEGDLLDIHVKSNAKADWGNRWSYNFGGLASNINTGWIYAFEIVGLFDSEGNDISLLGQTDKNELSYNNYADKDSRHGENYDQRNVSYWSSYQEVVIRVKADRLGIRTSNAEKRAQLVVRYFGVSENTVTQVYVTNYTQESENLTHSKLQEFIDDHAQTTQLYRADLTLDQLKQWREASNYPDGYTYFALEHTPAGYVDTYSIVDDENGNEVVTIENRPVELEKGQELGALSVSKEVVGLPEGSYDQREYQFRVKNGSKYLVHTGKADGAEKYELMTLAQLARAGYALDDDATYSIKAGESGGMTFDGLYPAIYVIEEVGTPQEPGFSLETTCTGNGRVGVNLGEESLATITNTYTPEATEVSFGKLWASDDNKPISWPDGQTVDVVVHRSVKDVPNSEDSGFALTYTLDAQGATLKSDAENKVPDPERLEDVRLTTVLDNAVSPYFAYRYKLEGLAKDVLVGEHAGKEWVYYVTEDVPGDAAYECSYGQFGGTSAAAVAGKANAQAKPGADLITTDYVINKFASTSMAFTKKWFDGLSDRALETWPQRQRARVLDADGNVVNPEAEAEFEDVPISVTLKRKLSYGGPFKSETDFDPNFEVAFTGLTSSTTAREQNTPEGKLTLAMSADGASFNYTVSGLRAKGVLDGETGDWNYYVAESALDGYATAYTLAGVFPGAPDGAYTNEHGTISNTRKLGTIVVEKAVEGLPGGANKSFQVTVTNQDGLLLAQDGTLSARADDDASAVYSISAGDKLKFDNVPAGTYSVAELGTEAGGSAQVPGYTLNAHMEGGGVVEVEGGDIETARIVNTYTQQTTDFVFTKVWYGPDWERPTEWLTDSITVTLHRSYMPEGGPMIKGEDVTMTIYPQDGTSAYDYKVASTSDPVSYKVTIMGLEKFVPYDRLPEGVDASQAEWTYTLEEKAEAGYYVQYIMKGLDAHQGAEYVDDGGTVENHLETYALPSTGGPGALPYVLVGMLMALASAGILLYRRFGPARPVEP